MGIDFGIEEKEKGKLKKINTSRLSAWIKSIHLVFGRHAKPAHH